MCSASATYFRVESESDAAKSRQCGARPAPGHPAQVTVTVTVSDHRIVTRRRDRDYAVKSTGTIRNRYQKSQSEFQATTRTHDPIRVLRIIMSLIF